ncbi:MAG: rod shape-determining protein MreC [Bacteroidetes bacterium]|jgi:rod shape-determining protein MreC|nr:MAG: rod shape-determining protein MreC [Bacteroidota bacterium]UCE69313.1 MAG: rod shape-determining protein MreC [Flavobacteriaceae bacterium]
MQRIINFILRNKNTLLYALLLLISFLLTIQNNDYHRARYFNSANWLSGTVYNSYTSVGQYFDLKAHRDELLRENALLKEQLYNMTGTFSVEMDTSSLDFEVLSARVIKNSYANPDNYITINRGSSDSVLQDMGVISSHGILGIVERSSSNFASVQSVLNSKSNINAKIQHTNYFGSLTWDQQDFRIVQLEDIPRLNPDPMKIGDTIVTGAMSSIFPENIPIGTIVNIDLNQAGSLYEIDVHLFNDMTNLGQVYIIRNRKRPEILGLENQTNDD